MNTNHVRAGRAISWLVLALVAAGLVAAATYLNLERKNESAQAFRATLDRLNHEQQLSAALKKIHGGEVEQAARSLDLLLCGEILLTNAELPCADAETRAIVQDTFRRIALARPKTEGAAGVSTQEHVNDQVAAERILACALPAPNKNEFR
jgi:hypothetical protein